MPPHMDSSSRRRARSRPDSAATADGATEARSTDDPSTPEIKLRLAGTAPLSAVPADDSALAVLREACRLLDSLRDARDRLDERLAAAGRKDPVKLVTGQTALDRVCTETEEMIRVMDELLSETAERLLAAPRAGV